MGWIPTAPISTDRLEMSHFAGLSSLASYCGRCGRYSDQLYQWPIFALRVSFCRTIHLWPTRICLRVPKANLQSAGAVLPLEQISHPRVAVVHALAHLVGGVAHMYEGHKGEHYHHREQQEAHEDDREQTRHGPSHGQDHYLGNLVPQRLQSVEGDPRRAIPVHQPDHERRHRPQEARDEVQEDGEVGQNRLGVLVFEVHGCRAQSTSRF